MAKSYIDNEDLRGSRREPERCKFDLGEYVLLQMALLFMTKNVSANHRLRSKVLEFLEQVDDMQYGDNHDLCWRISLARGIGRATLLQGAKNLPAVEHRVLENTDWADYHANFFEAYRNDTGHAAEGVVVGNELSNDDVAYVDSYVSTRLRFAYLWESRGFMREMADRIDSGDMGEVSIFNDRVLAKMEKIVQTGRQARALSAQETQDFSTGDSSFEAAIRATHAARNKPQSTVKTGIAYLNEMLGGGYEGSRTYVHFGRSGDWKSGILCSAAFWACDPRFNPRYETKDPTKKPCVIFLTMENDLFETIERMISFSLGSHVDLRGADPDQIVRMMEGAFSSETCKFIFKYRQSNSITTADLEAMIHDEYLKGNEVVMIVQDYIKRIKSVQTYRDQRHLELGAVVDELSGIAKRYNIPCVTGMQLNRDAYLKFDAAIKSGKTDAVKELGASNVGESINVFENADCVIFQGRVNSEALGGRLFLTMRRAKMRGKRKASLDYFAQPFALDDDGDVNEMKLCEDSHLPQKQWRGLKDMSDGLTKMYDANADDGAPMQSSEERRQSRTAGLVGGKGGRGGSSGGKRNNAPPQRRDNPPPRNYPSEAGPAKVEYIPGHDEELEDDQGFQGL